MSHEPGVRPLQVFLFGHYDSRGGTTAVISPDRQAACRAYARACWLDDLGYNPDEQREFILADYLGPATFEGVIPAGMEGADLEWDLDGAVFCKSTGQLAGRDDEDRARWFDPDMPIELLYVATPHRDADGLPIPPVGYWYPRWDDDEYGFVLVRSV